MLRFALPFVVLLAGCGVSVNHSSTGPGTYLVTADGEDHHSHGEVSRAAHDRAMHLCGPNGYTVQSHGTGSQTHGQANEDGAYVGTKGSVALYIVCNDAQAPAGAPAPAPAAAPPVDGSAPSGY